MRVALTGATGFLGRYIAADLDQHGYRLRCWFRPTSDRSAMPESIEWIEGRLDDDASAEALVAGADAVVHSALDRPGRGFTGAEGDIPQFVQTNVVGTLRLIEAARRSGAGRFIFISTCAVHDIILDDRPLDEAHPLWPRGHYGAHKAAIEKFVHSYGFGQGYDICALRPTGIYGLAHPPQRSRWFDLVARVKRGQRVEVRRGGKEVHAADVARAVRLLLEAPAEAIRGQAFNCYDRYVSEYDVAHIARRLCGSDAEIIGEQIRPKHQIQTGKIRALGMSFGGDALLEQTIAQMLEHA